MNDEERDYLESLLQDEQSLHRQLCLCVADKVPNLRDGGLESYLLIDFADRYPSIACPNCGVRGDEGRDSPYFTPSLVILSVSNQKSYLCANCWKHNPIPAFGIYTLEDQT